MDIDAIATLDRDTLLCLLKQSQATTEQLVAQNQHLLAQNEQLQETIEQLSHQINKLQQLLFGQKSERQRNQKKKGAQASNAKNNGKDSSTSGHGRRPLPADLPRTVIKHTLPEEEQCCIHCQCALHCIGKTVTEQLGFIPAKLYVLEHRRYRYACRGCGTLFTAPLPEQPIDKGLASSELLAQTLIDKYEDHLPLYRQEKRYERLGYRLSRSTLCDWVSQCADRLAPIVDAMEQQLLARSPKIHSDDTTIPVLEKGKTHTGRLWVYIGGGGQAPPSVIYRYTKTRAGKHPQQFLKTYRGYLQADAYAGYDQCYASGAIREVACWAHCRRKFVEAQSSADPEDSLARTAIEMIGQLYQVEKVAKAMNDRYRYYYRRHHASRILKVLYRWLCREQQRALPKSPLGQAINYALNHWRAFNTYLREGVLSIDNNIAERAMKSVVLGRKNYLFAGSHAGAKSAAVIYSLIETCKHLDINTFDYLSDVLKRLPTTLNKDIDSLLPYHWQPFS